MGRGGGGSERGKGEDHSKAGQKLEGVIIIIIQVNDIK